MPSRTTLSPNMCICRVPACKIPFGLCHCGCGGKTRISTFTDKNRGYIMGMPNIFILQHHAYIRPEIVEAAPFKIGGVYCRLIPLSSGQYTIVWESDYKWLMQWKWHARWDKHTRSFYACRTDCDGEKHETIQMHRLIMGVPYGDKRQVDHIDSGNCLDNRRTNLRIVSASQNSMNKRARRNSKSGLKGVSWRKADDIYEASIRVDGKLIILGQDTDPQKCHQLYKDAAIKHFGEYARFE